MWMLSFLGIVVGGGELEELEALLDGSIERSHMFTMPVLTRLVIGTWRQSRIYLATGLYSILLASALLQHIAYSK
jgi:hypothetical protein